MKPCLLSRETIYGPPSMPENCAHSFMSDFYAGRQPDMNCIDQLCRLAFSQEASVADRAVCSLYGSIVEGLCDDFSSRGVAVCNQVLLRIVAFLKEEGRIESLAGELGLDSPDWQENLLHRHDRLVSQGLLPLKERPEKILVLSRVTIGADVMITSILVQRMRMAFPNAEIVLVGPSHMEALLLFDQKVRSRLFPYIRKCSVMERFECCYRLMQLIREECSGLGRERILLVDPDTRLSQLGLMPLLPVERIRYFCSRMEMEDKTGASLVEISNRWLDQWLGSGRQICYPAVHLSPEIRQLAGTFVDRVRGGGKPVVLVNLGVGRNENKRIPPPFEEQLLLALLRHPDLVVLLDSGSSPAGLARARNLMQQVERDGHQCGFVREEDLAGYHPDSEARLIGLKSSIGMVAALIAEADCFFGYDSCCQHLANAVQSRGVIVFSGYRLQRFLERWRPVNPRESITVFPCPSGGEMDLQQRKNLVEEVARAVREKI